MGIEIGGGSASVDLSEYDKNITFGMTFIFHGDTTIGVVHFYIFFVLGKDPKGTKLMIMNCPFSNINHLLPAFSVFSDLDVID